MCKVSRGLQNEGRRAGGILLSCLAADHVDVAGSGQNGKTEWNDDQERNSWRVNKTEELAEYAVVHVTGISGQMPGVMHMVCTISTIDGCICHNFVVVQS